MKNRSTTKERNTKAAAPVPDGRRVPTQQRSRERVERILVAAAEVFANEGFGATTMEAIAAKAETSIGSIYQFFPNKAVVFDALIVRYHERLRVFLDALLGGDNPLMQRPWSEIIDAAIDALYEIHSTDPGFRAVWVGMNLTKKIVREGEAVNRELAHRISIVLGHRLGKLPARRRLFVSMMVVEIVSAMLILSTRRPTDGKAIMAETKTLLRLYLSPYDDDS